MLAAIERALGRHLCRIGRHDFDIRVAFIFETYYECSRCGARESVR